MQFRAHIDELASMLAWIRSEGARAGLDARTLHQVELASEEGITNIIRHALGGGDEGGIEIACDVPKEGQFQIILKDKGEAVNPLETSPPVDLDVPASERSLGGLGVFLIQNLMDEVTYARKGEYNVLTMLKRI